MSPNMINSDAICDLQGNPLRPKSATLLKALDRLLTVGAYYSTEHDQYLQAAMKARDDIVGVIGSPRHHVAIEITAQGLMVGTQNIDPNHRNVRLLHDLLVPLNIARLEIDGTLTPEDLRQAIAALLTHKQTLGQSNTFQEIVIQNLPPSVRTVGCSVAQQTGDTSGGVSLDDLLGKWGGDEDDDQISQSPVSESEELARQFMDMVTQILANMEKLDREVGIKAQNPESGSYVTAADLVNLKQALQRLVEVNPDPADLTKLIAHAQRALGLSRDARSVDLVFQILKKDMADKPNATPRKEIKKPTRARYDLSIAELMSAVADLDADTTVVADQWAGARANELAMGLHLLRSDPPRVLRTSLVELIERAVVHPEFSDHNLSLCAEAAATIVQEDGVDGLDELLPLIIGVLRQKQPQTLALFWAYLLEIAATDHLPELWPHLVNDILFGFDKAPVESVLKLVLAAGDLPLLSAVSQGHRLEKQPALQGKSASRDLFRAPLPRLHAVYVMLMTSPLRGWVGEEVYRSLRTKPISPLVEVLMTALGQHHPEHAAFYLELIENGANKVLAPAIKGPAAAILHSALDDMAPPKRRAPWVVRGLRTLWALDPDLARPLFDRVLRERKYFFLKAWPAPARKAVTAALAADNKEAV